MAKSKRSRAPAAQTKGNGPNISQRFQNVISTSFARGGIVQRWSALPVKARSFILDAPETFSPKNIRFLLTKLIEFWSSPKNIGYTCGKCADVVFGTTLSLALEYLQSGMFFNEALACTINGAFVHQCCNSSIEFISNCVKSSGDDIEQNIDKNLPYFMRGVSSTQSPEKMKAFLQGHLPLKYKQDVMGYVDQISDDWKGISSASKSAHHRSSSSNDGKQIKLVLVDDANEDERHSVNISVSMSLKALFNEYADKRGISLRSLRFSYAGKILFLSSAGHKTPEELGMQGKDVIMVHDTSKTKEPSNDNSSSGQAPTPGKATAKKRLRNKKAKGKSKKPQQPEKLAKSLEEYKVQHSKILTQIHEEAQDQFKHIRQRLNNLVIERNKPKVRSKCARMAKNNPSLPFLNNHFKEGLGGKAGKSHYAVQVGEVHNLYKSTKPSVKASHCSSSSTLLKLDLHGHTREEALTNLDKTLKIWVDTAMRGSYPFVRSATIVCGCGNQILSETVQEWIRSNDKVSNAPKVRSPKRCGFKSLPV